MERMSMSHGTQDDDRMSPAARARELRPLLWSHVETGLSWHDVFTRVI